MLNLILGAALARTAIPLAALGFPDGIPLTGGAVTIRLPVLPGVQRVAVHFPIDGTGTLSHALVRIEIDGRELATKSGAQLQGATLEAQAAVVDGTHAIDITVLSRLTQCVQTVAPQLRIDKTASVTIMQDANAARTVLGSYAGAYTIIEPPHADATWRAHALTAAYALHVDDGWRNIAVSLGSTPAPGTIAVSDPTSVVLHEDVLPKGARTFAALGVYPLEQSGENVDFVVPFTLGQLGDVPNRLVATLHVRASAPGRLEATFNGKEINAFSIAAGTQTLRIPVRVAALRGVNALRFDVTFNQPKSFCETDAPSIALDGSELRWYGDGDIPMTLERRLGELSGKITVESDPAIFPQAFAVISTLGSINHTIDAIELEPLARNESSPAEIEIGAAPDLQAEDNGSYGEVRVTPNGAILVSYVGSPAVLDRLSSFHGVLASSDATSFEFGLNGAATAQGGPFSTQAQARLRIRHALYIGFIVVLVVATALIARRARRFS